MFAIVGLAIMLFVAAMRWRDRGRATDALPTPDLGATDLGPVDHEFSRSEITKPLWTHARPVPRAVARDLGVTARSVPVPDESPDFGDDGDDRFGEDTAA